VKVCSIIDNSSNNKKANIAYCLLDFVCKRLDYENSSQTNTYSKKQRYILKHTHRHTSDLPVQIYLGDVNMM